MVRLAIFTAISSLALSSPAYAQFSFGGDAPIKINAEQATYKGNLTVLTGNVDVQQGEARILSDEMKIYRKSGTDENLSSPTLGVVTRIEAIGNFEYITPDNKVTGQRGVYERETAEIVVTGNVVLTQPSGSSVRGDKLTYFIKTKNAKIGDECVGDNCNGRVQFEVKN